jgi:hypothetical protein
LSPYLPPKAQKQNLIYTDTHRKNGNLSIDTLMKGRRRKSESRRKRSRRKSRRVREKKATLFFSFSGFPFFFGAKNLKQHSFCLVQLKKMMKLITEGKLWPYKEKKQIWKYWKMKGEGVRSQEV